MTASAFPLRRGALHPADWRLVDDASRAMFGAVELAATLRAVVDLFVPAHAAGALLALHDEHGVLRIAAAAPRRALARAIGRDFADDPARTLGASGGRVADIVLSCDGAPVGVLRLLLEGELEPRREALLHTIAERSAQALRNALRFERERNVALTFQNAALVSQLPVVPGYRFDAIYRAGRLEALVGGDWYDAFPLGDGRAIVSIGDVVGSGLSAAVTMVDVRQAIRAVAQVNPDPAVMLHAAEGTLRSQFPDRYVTAFVGVLDPLTQVCSYANAGHPAPLLRLADGSLYQLRGNGAPLGLGFEQRIEVHHVTLPSGALFVLYTDGLIESTKDVLEGEARLEAVLRDGELDCASGIARRIHDAVLVGPSRDDVVVLAVAVGESMPARRWRFDPRWEDVARRARTELRRELDGVGLSAGTLLDVELVFAELMGNAIRYAPGTIELILVRRAGGTVLHVLDKGPGFHFSPRLPSDLYSEFGRGLFLISRLVRDLTVEPRPGGGSHARIILT